MFEREEYIVFAKNFRTDLVKINLPRKEGWKRASGHLNRSFPMVMTCPSGSS